MTDDTSNGGKKSDHDKGPNNNFDARLYHLIFGVLLTLIAAGAEFKFLWSEAHGFSLLFLAATLCALATYEILAVYRLHVGWLLAFIFLTALSTLYAYQIIGPALPEETETHGWLMPANAARPPSACDDMLSIGYVPRGGHMIYVKPADTDLILFGNLGVLHPTPGQVLVLSIEGAPIVGIVNGQQGLLVFAEIHNKAGLLVARIQMNEFHLMQSQISYTERRDRSSLVVYDPKGDEVLNVQFLNPHTFQILGKFYGADGTEVIATPK